MRTPAAAAAVPLLLGILAGVSLAEAVGVPLARAAAGAAFLALVAAAGALGHEDDEVVGAVALAVGFACTGVSLGASAGLDVYRPSLLRWFESRGSADAVSLAGRLRADAAAGAFGPALIVDVDGIRTQGRPGETHRVHGGVRLTISGQLASERMGGWRAGRRVRVLAALRKPAFYLNPGVPDDRRAQARRGVVLVGTVKSAALVEVISHGSPLEEAAGVIRAWVRRTLRTHVGRWSARSGAISTAILIGDRTGLDAEDTRRLQDAGTYHVIAISGGNIAILAALCLAVCRLIGMPERTRAALVIALLVFYGRITGAAPSVDRAIAAAALYLAARIIDHRAPALNILAVAALLGAAASPITLIDPGFLLSFGATLGILVGAERLAWVPADAKGRARRLLRGAAALLAATVSAEAALAPLGAVLFSRVTMAGLLLNFAAIPLMTVVQAASLATLAAAGLAPPLASIAGRVAHAAAIGLVDSARLVDVVPILARDVVPPAWWVVAAYYVSLACALALGRRARWLWAIPSLAAALIAVGWPRAAPGPMPAARAGTLRVVFLDVGQGDATLAILPDGRALLVDSGGTSPVSGPDDSDATPSAFDVGARVVGPALRALGVRRLDLFVATHGDPDHIGGARALLRSFQPPQIWEGVPVPPHAGLQMLRAAADAAGATWRTVQAGDREQHGPVIIRALHPPLPDWERQRVRNEDSVVLDLRIGRVSIVLPGDIGREGEAVLLPRIMPAPLTVLKAPHHGSATSSTPRFVSALRPRIVVFSAGRANRFGHPAPSVVSRYASAGATLFSTAEDGAVILDTDGESVQVTGWRGRVVKLRVW